MPTEVTDYLERLELPGPPAVDIDGLRLLHERHLLRVPFENLDIIDGDGISFELDAILDKIVRRRRGGFCYELNSAFAWLLQEIGFETAFLEVRVSRPDGGFGIPFDHMALVVQLERPWLCDVGFGATSFIHPLDFDASTEVRQQGDHFRLILQDDGARILHRRPRAVAESSPSYRIEPGERRREEFRGGFEHHSTSSESHFTRRSVAMMRIPDGMVKVTDDGVELTRRGRATLTPHADADGFDREVRRLMGIRR